MSGPVRVGVSFSRLAEMDIADSFDWYNAHSPDLGDQFLRSITESASYLASYPEGAPLVYKNTRCCVVRGFPYCVYYHIRRERVRVIAVMHQRRHPRDWKARVK